MAGVLHIAIAFLLGNLEQKLNGEEMSKKEKKNLF